MINKSNENKFRSFLDLEDRSWCDKLNCRPWDSGQVLHTSSGGHFETAGSSPNVNKTLLDDYYNSFDDGFICLPWTPHPKKRKEKQQPGLCVFSLIVSPFDVRSGYPCFAGVCDWTFGWSSSPSSNTFTWKLATVWQSQPKSFLGRQTIWSSHGNALQKTWAVKRQKWIGTFDCRLLSEKTPWNCESFREIGPVVLDQYSICSNNIDKKLENEW